MSNVETYSKNLIPLSRAVNASIVDVYGDVGKTYELHSHWAARVYKDLQRKYLKQGRRTVLLTVNASTRTATLPLDFEEELFVGYIENGIKIPIGLSTDLIDEKSIEEVPCEDKCPKCNSNKAICEDLTVTENVEPVIINGNTYEITTIKKLYDNGNYYLEKTIPYYNTEIGVVQYATTKEFITKISLKPCGCVEETEENIEVIRCCNEDVYSCYFAECSNVCDTNFGGYKIFEKTGLIQLSYKYNKPQIYMEYRGFMNKVKGQYMIPEVSFESVVEGIKAMSVDGKPNVPMVERMYRWERYKIVTRNMRKILGRINLSQIIQAISLTPKFDFDNGWNRWCGAVPQSNTITNASITECESSADACSNVTTTTKKLTPFQIAVVVPEEEIDGLPVPGSVTYQNDVLVGALQLNNIIVNNNNENRPKGDFTFDDVTGTITRGTNQWFAGDVLIINFVKLV